jgi:hypothetical protein
MPSIDGQVCLVRLQTDSFRLFLRQQMDKRQTSVLQDEQTVNSRCPHVSMYPFPQVYLSILPCLHLHASMPPCFHVSANGEWN